MKKKINNFITVSKRVNAASKSVEADVYIYGDIVGTAWFEDEVTPSQILMALDEIENPSLLNVHINSYGGEINAGNAIICMLNNYRQKNKIQIHGYVEGIAASMGSGILMVADKIFMYDNSILMIHKPLAMMGGNADELRAEADLLDKFEELLINNYNAHFNGTEEELRQMLSDETWLTAEEALSYGLCDEVLKAIDIVAYAGQNKIVVNDMTFERKEIVDIFKQKTKNLTERKQNEMKYDIALQEKLGITEEDFNAFASPVDFAERVTNQYIASIEVAVAEPDVIVPEAFMTMETAKEKLGFEKDVTSDEVLNLALKGKDYKEPDPTVEAKVKEYDKLFGSLVKDALANGVTALGQDFFSDNSWSETLKSMSYDKVKNISDTWVAQAKLNLNAGKRNSVQNGVKENDMKNIKDENLNV